MCADCCAYESWCIFVQKASVCLQMLGLAVYLAIEDGRDATALLPVFDLLNHEARQEVLCDQPSVSVLPAMLINVQSVPQTELADFHCLMSFCTLPLLLNDVELIVAMTSLPLIAEALRSFFTWFIWWAY